MIYIKLNKEKNNWETMDCDLYEIIKNDTLALEQAKKEGFFISELPQDLSPTGMQGILKYDRVKNELYYEYVEIVKTEMELLQENVNSLGEQLAQEKLKNIQKDATISQLGQEIAKLKLEIIGIKGGV